MRSTVITLVLLTLTSTMVIVDARSTSAIIDQAEQFVSSGGSTIILTAPQSIDPRACESLVGVSGVIAAGALRASSEDLRLDLLPGSAIPTYDSTPGLAQILATADVPTGGLLMSESLAADLSVESGSDVSIDGQPAPIASVFDWPTDGRRSDFEYSLFTPVPTLGLFDECWVQERPEKGNASVLIRQALSVGSDPDTPVEIGQLNSSLGQSFDGAEMFDARLTRFGPIAVFFVTSLLFAALVVSRRVELASALHAGVRRNDLVVQLIIEMLVVWSVAVVGATIAFGIATSDRSAGDLFAIAAGSLATIVSACFGALIGIVAATAGIQEARLFKYFKGRQ